MKNFAFLLGLDFKHCAAPFWPITNGRGLKSIAFCKNIAQFVVIAKSCKNANPFNLSFLSNKISPALLPLFENSINLIVL